MVMESNTGAYLGPGAQLRARVRRVLENPNFDVFDTDGRRLILGKCSRLPDDEDPRNGRYGIDFHRRLPPFQGASGVTCDWGEGPIPVNAYAYAQYLPKTLRFREFTANLAFAARTLEDYEAKGRVYQDFYRYLYQAPGATVIAAPHAGAVRRPPDRYHPFPQSETDAWSARVGVRCLDGAPRTGRGSSSPCTAPIISECFLNWGISVCPRTAGSPGSSPGSTGVFQGTWRPSSPPTGITWCPLLSNGSGGWRGAGAPCTPTP